VRVADDGRVDLDAYIAVHRPAWERLRQLTKRANRLSGAEADELVVLYQRVATHLSVIRSAAPDATVVAELSTLLARARGAVTGGPESGLRELTRFFTASFPAAVYRHRHWWITAGLVWITVSVAIGWYVAATPSVQAAVGAPDEIRQLVQEDFVNYYSEHPATSFAARVWTNNAWVAAACLVLGIALGLPVVWVLWQNAVNVGVAAGLMAAYGRLDIFFGLITPHGLLELTAVFIAAGVGLRLGWTVIDPGPRPRSRAVAEEGRAAVGVALGVALVLVISGLIEAFVTPSGLPTWGRIAVGAVAEVVFLTYVWTLGRHAVTAGETGDLLAEDRGASAPVVG
jgi:uncharacterized membrane protein SpoIIM required for sporulation